MAVENKYTDATQQADGRANALTSLASTISAGLAGVVVAAVDDDNSVYRIFRDVPVSMTLFELQAIVTTGITGSTGWSAGVGKTRQNGSTTIKADLFTSAQTLAAAGSFNLLAGVATANTNLSIADLYFTVVGSNIGESEVDIILTATTVGSADGGFRVRALGAHN